MLKSALACQPLAHYSDFDTTSESGLSDLSYVHPYRPKKCLTKNKTIKTTPGEIRLGARAMRRYENEVYLNTLAVITETDGDTIDDWPDSLNYCSAFTKLFEDENIREVWEKFIQLSEREQEKLLKSLRIESEDDDFDDDDDEEAGGISDYDEVANDMVCTFTPPQTSPKRSTKHRCRRHKHASRGKKNKNTVNLLEADLALSESSKSEEDTYNLNANALSDECRLEIEQHIPTRLLSLLSNSPNSHNSKTNRKRVKRALTPIDICLLKRVELELRQHFFQRDQVNNIAKRWTPSLSLISSQSIESSSNSNNSNTGNRVTHSNFLCLDSFQRLLVHSIATYLGLSSYSTWSNSLGERQLWVEQVPERHYCQPPKQHFVTLIQHKVMQNSSLTANTS
ncbi:unnamed protein product [Trichobilharzia szidati]|nr:unnamed protein product [Trichobilharzia szidati]CAH8848663.1 unnamed protein product [Trichobilharzia szidati]